MSSEFERLIQIGIVTDTDTENHKVRVKFKDVNLTSDWLCVLQNTPRISLVVGSVGDATLTREATIYPWMPAVNDVVLVIYLPIFNSDGFVIGGI